MSTHMDEALSNRANPDMLPATMPPAAPSVGAEIIPIRPEIAIYPSRPFLDMMKALRFSEIDPTETDENTITVDPLSLTVDGVSDALGHIVRQRTPEETKPAAERDLSITQPLQAQSDRLEKWLFDHFKRDPEQVGDRIMRAYGL